MSEDKLGLLYEINLKLNDTLYDLTTYSSPIIVTVHHNQDIHARATIFWDNAFASNLNRVPYMYENTLKWGQLKLLLDGLCHRRTGTAGLSPLNMQVLHLKLTGNVNETDESEISFARFCHDELVKGLNYSFWEWFDKALQLIQKYFAEEWGKGHIMGFVNKSDATSWLETQDPGYFLLRFSDTEIGGVSIAYTTYDRNDETYYVKHLAPLTTTHLSARNLNKQLNDLSMLRLIFPSGVVKMNAFPLKKREEKGTVTKDGYISIDNPTVENEK